MTRFEIVLGVLLAAALSHGPVAAAGSASSTRPTSRPMALASKKTASSQPRPQPAEPEIEQLKARQDVAEAMLDLGERDRKRQTRVFGLVDQAFHRAARAGNNGSFDNSEVYLMLQADLSPGWTAWAEAELEHDGSESAAASASTKVRVDRAFVTRRTGESLNLRLGQVFTPWGLWNKIHWRPRVPTWTEPLSQERELLPVHAAGVEAFGTAGDADKLEYALSLFSDRETDSTVARKDGNVWALADIGFHPNPRWHFGLTGADMIDPAPLGRRERGGALYGRGFLDPGRRLELWAEATRQVSSAFQTTDVWAQLQWECKRRHFLGVRQDALTRDEAAAGLRHDRTTLFLDYKPNPNTILGLEVSADDFADPATRDYKSVVMRVGTVFGGL